MQIKSIVAGATIALIAGVGSVAVDELYAAETTPIPDARFTLLDGITASQLSVQEMAALRGGGGAMAYSLHIVQGGLNILLADGSVRNVER